MPLSRSNNEEQTLFLKFRIIDAKTIIAFKSEIPILLSKKREIKKECLHQDALYLIEKMMHKLNMSCKFD